MESKPCCGVCKYYRHGICILAFKEKEVEWWDYCLQFIKRKDVY